MLSSLAGGDYLCASNRMSCRQSLDIPSLQQPIYGRVSKFVRHNGWDSKLPSPPIFKRLFQTSKNGSSESCDHMVDSSASHTCQLLHRSLSTQSSCLSFLDSSSDFTNVKFHPPNTTAIQPTGQQIIAKCKGSTIRLHLNNTFVSLITTELMFLALLNFGKIKYKKCCLKFYISWCY
jgi:hypothetical protein